MREAAGALAYADPGAPRVGLLDAGTRLTVLGEIGDYRVVNLRCASAFIHKSASIWTDADIVGSPVIEQ